MNVPNYASDLADQVLATLLEEEDSPDARRWAEGAIETMIEVLASGRLERYETTLRVCAESVVEHGLPADAREQAGAALHGALHLAASKAPVDHRLASAFAQMPDEVAFDCDPLPEADDPDSGGDDGGAPEVEPRPARKKAKRGDRPPA